MNQVIGKPHVPATDEQVASLKKLVDGASRVEPSSLFVRYQDLLTQYTLRRFVTANNGNIDNAFEQLSNHLQWRQDYGVDGICEEDFSDMDALKEIFWHGFDNQGHPLIVWRKARHRRCPAGDRRAAAAAPAAAAAAAGGARAAAAAGAAPGRARFVRYLVHLIERGLRAFAPAQQFVVLVDCRGAGKRNVDLQALRLAQPVVEANYPERQHATYILPVGSAVTLAWKVVATFIDPGTAHKVRLLRGMHAALLRQAFPATTLQELEAMNDKLADDSDGSGRVGEREAYGKLQPQNSNVSVLSSDGNDSASVFSDLDDNGTLAKKGGGKSIEDQGSALSLLNDHKAGGGRGGTGEATGGTTGLVPSPRGAAGGGAFARGGEGEGEEEEEGAGGAGGGGGGPGPGPGLGGWRAGVLLKQRRRLGRWRPRYFVLDPGGGGGGGGGPGGGEGPPQLLQYTGPPPGAEDAFPENTVRAGAAAAAAPPGPAGTPAPSPAAAAPSPSPAGSLGSPASPPWDPPAAAAAAAGAWGGAGRPPPGKPPAKAVPLRGADVALEEPRAGGGGGLPGGGGGGGGPALLYPLTLTPLAPPQEPGAEPSPGPTITLAAHCPEVAMEWAAALAAASVAPPAAARPRPGGLPPPPPPPPPPPGAPAAAPTEGGEGRGGGGGGGGGEEDWEAEARGQREKDLLRWGEGLTAMLKQQDTAYLQLLERYEQLVAVTSALSLDGIPFEPSSTGKDSSRWINPDLQRSFDSSGLKPTSLSFQTSDGSVEQNRTTPTGTGAAARASRRGLLLGRPGGGGGGGPLDHLAPIRQDLEQLRRRCAALGVGQLALRDAAAGLQAQLRHKQREAAGLREELRAARGQGALAHARLRARARRLREENLELRARTLQLEGRLAGQRRRGGSGREDSAGAGGGAASPRPSGRSAPQRAGSGTAGQGGARRRPQQQPDGGGGGGEGPWGGGRRALGAGVRLVAGLGGQLLVGGGGGGRGRPRPKVLNRGAAWAGAARPLAELVDALHAQLRAILAAARAAAGEEGAGLAAPPLPPPPPPPPATKGGAGGEPASGVLPGGEKAELVGGGRQEQGGRQPAAGGAGADGATGAGKPPSPMVLGRKRQESAGFAAEAWAATAAAARALGGAAGADGGGGGAGGSPREAAAAVAAGEGKAAGKQPPPSWRGFERAACELQRVEWRRVPLKGRREVYARLHRLLLAHASIELNVPERDVMTEFASLVAYDIGGSIMPAADLKRRSGVR